MFENIRTQNIDNAAGIMGTSVRCVIGFAHDDRIFFINPSKTIVCAKD